MTAQKKQFTLEDLNFGGTRYYAMTPERRYYQWWGDKLILLQTDKAENAEGKGQTIRIALPEDEEMVGVNMLNASFPYSDKPLMLLNDSEKRMLYDFKRKKMVWSQSTKGSLQWNSCTKTDAFLKDNNLWIRLEDGTERQLTTDGSREIVYGQSVHRNEFGIDKGIFFAPDGKKMAFYRMDQSMVTDYPQVNTFTRIATHEPDKYPMAGTESHKVTVGIYDIEEGKTVYLNVGDPKDRYFTNIQWSPNGKSLFLFEVNREQKRMSLDCYSAINGDKVKTLYTETDERYVEPMHPIAFLPWNEKLFIMFSQQDGFTRLYLMNTDGKVIRKLTDNDGVKNKEYIVRDIIGFCEETKSVIISANVCDYTSMNIVSVGIEDGKKTILGPDFGVSTARLSGSGKKAICNYSNPETPRAYEMIDCKTAERKVLFNAKNPWDEYAIPTIKTGSIIAADDKTELRYRLVLPPDFNEKTDNRKLPVVVYVYGGPHAHLINDSWNYNARSWEIYMAQKGYAIFVLDGRGSENRGKEFEQVTYRQLGQEEMKDQIKGVNFLATLPYIDTERIGVHGWSYGGYMTISLMTNYPDIFKVGVAGGPVIDWKWYEVMYGERYMGTPENNPDGYAKTSLLNKAEKLKGRLQIIIGANDPIVVPQHALQFINACNEAGTQPDFYIYPGEEHNMQGHHSVHLHERITRYFEDFLPVNK